MKIYFSDFFEVQPSEIEEYGAFDISLINDLPLFIDPFLLFNSNKAEYKDLHQSIIKYVIFLKELSQKDISDDLITSLFTFPEVKQNWFGYSRTGNDGSGLGKKFAFALRHNLTNVFSNFGQENISKGTHLEKLCLIDSGVGRDNISDFVTNLIKKFILSYTQSFSLKHINNKFLKKFNIPKVSFNYSTFTWVSAEFTLPTLGNDFVLLTPKDILTKDVSWINRADTLQHLAEILNGVPNRELRAHMNLYFKSKLPKRANVTQKDEQEALSALIRQYPAFLDYYIQYKESKGNDAVSISEEKVKNTETIFINQLRELVKLLQETDFYETPPWSAYNEAMQRVSYLKQTIENNDGYRLFYYKGQPIKREADLQLIFRLTWYATDFDVNAEVNNGRGPVDFKISKGSSNQVLVEFKLASNSKLRNNIAKQVEVYEAANQSDKSIKVILFFSSEEEKKVKDILKELGLEKNNEIVLIDARNDNKPSASNVTIS